MADPRVLSRAPIRVRVGEEEFELPWRPAAEWIPATMRGSALVSILAEPRDRDRMVDALLSHTGARADMARESRRILTESCGRKWYEAQRLINTSLQPEALGRLVLAGVDPWNRTIGEWCAALYALYVKGADEKARTKLNFSLALPPPGAEDQWDDEGVDASATLAAVRALMGQ